MKKILKFLSAGFLILTFPVTALGASYESEEGQAMIGPPLPRQRTAPKPSLIPPLREPPPASTGTPPIPLRLRPQEAVISLW